MANSPIIGGVHPSIRQGYRPDRKDAELTMDDVRACFGALDTPSGQTALRSVIRACLQYQSNTKDIADEPAPQTA